MTPPAPVPSPADLGFGRLFWKIHEGVVVADVDTGRIVQWNPAAEKVFGYSAAEAVGMPLETLVPEHLKERYRAGLAHYRETGRGRLIEADGSIEVPTVRKDGA
jgi:PAS domain S-box-containing protein